MRRPSCCWTKPTRSSALPKDVFPTLLTIFMVSACAPGTPPGVDKAELDAAVSCAVGDPNTCVLIAEQGIGEVLYRFNTATACARQFPACDRPGLTTVAALLEATAKDSQVRQASCDTVADGSRGVGWAAGPIAGKNLVYAAVMEGDRVLPGMIMADRLEGALRRARVSTEP